MHIPWPYFRLPESYNDSTSIGINGRSVSLPSDSVYLLGVPWRLELGDLFGMNEAESSSSECERTFGGG